MASPQSNQVSVERAFVDLSLPKPASCPDKIRHIAQLYMDGDRERHMPRHRIPIFKDERASKYRVSKVFDRNETPRCPHILQE